MRPVFLSENVEFDNKPKIVGTNHLVVTLKQNGSDKFFECIGFNMAGYYLEMSKKNCMVDIVYNIDKSTRNGISFPQFRLKDIKFKENNVELI